jgi:hypothetical protein
MNTRRGMRTSLLMSVSYNCCPSPIGPSHGSSPEPPTRLHTLCPFLVHLSCQSAISPSGILRLVSHLHPPFVPTQSEPFLCDVRLSGAYCRPIHRSAAVKNVSSRRGSVCEWLVHYLFIVVNGVHRRKDIVVWGLWAV